MGFKQFLFVLSSSKLFPRNLRDALCHKILDVKGCGFRENVHINDIKNIHIGTGCYVGPGVQFHNGKEASVTLKDNVLVAPNVHFYCTTHGIGDGERRASDVRHLDIVVENGCWICTDSVILPGVTVAGGCIVAAGAVVTKSTLPDGLYAGVPAKRIKDL